MIVEGGGAKTGSEALLSRAQEIDPTADDAADEQAGIGVGAGTWHLETDSLYLATNV